jgi:hypothetical protein
MTVLLSDNNSKALPGGQDVKSGIESGKAQADNLRNDIGDNPA